MKKVVLLLAVLLISATCAFATPVYTGDTYAAWGEGGVPTLPTATGYYIWSNNADKTSWSVRWTGNGEGVTDSETWVGNVEFINNDNTSTTAVMWEASGSYADGAINHHDTMFGEFITYEGAAGPAWDGFDFTLVGDVSVGLLRFNLGGSYYSDLDLSVVDTPANAMWIGDGEIMDVFVEQWNDGVKYQSFETYAPVPEPATLLLLGSGLAGLAFLKRRKS